MTLSAASDSQLNFRLEPLAGSGPIDLEPELFADPLHAAIFRKDVGRDPGELFIAADHQETPQ